MLFGVLSVHELVDCLTKLLLPTSAVVVALLMSKLLTSCGSLLSISDILQLLNTVNNASNFLFSGVVGHSGRALIWSIFAKHVTIVNLLGKEIGILTYLVGGFLIFLDLSVRVYVVQKFCAL